VVVIFRGDGITRDVGLLAAQAFGGLGSAGGHKGMARAEIPLSAAKGEDVELFLWQVLSGSGKSKRKSRADEESAEG
jgi:nanoRNase/pAp phosphatase (c-di-AMP/oligoRNAs hydrolase)